VFPNANTTRCSSRARHLNITARISTINVALSPRFCKLGEIKLDQISITPICSDIVAELMASDKAAPVWLEAAERILFNPASDKYSALQATDKQR